MTTWATFESMTDEVRDRGLMYVMDHQSYLDTLNSASHTAANDNDDAAWFIYDSSLRDLLFLWLECNRDMVLTKLTWVE